MLEKSIINEGDILTLEKRDFEKVDMDTKENCEKGYQLFEQAIGKYNQKIIYLTGKQGEVLVKLKKLCKKEGRLIDYLIFLQKFRVEEPTANLKIRLAELIKEFPKLQNTNLSLNLFNKYMKQIRLICEKSGKKYK